MAHPNRLRMTMRWLLQVDPPVVPRTDTELSAEIEKNYRWNFTVSLLDGATFWFGLSFISSTTIVPLFLSKLTDSPLPIGIAAVISQSAWFLPQLFTANLVERLPRKKPVVVNAGFFLQRLPMWVIVVAALLAIQSPLGAAVLFLLAYAWHGLGAGIIATAWQDMIARCFPVERRGRFLGITLFVGAGTGAAAAGFSAWLLESFPFPTNFVYTFLVAAIGINLSWAWLALTREPVQGVTTPRQSNRQFFADLPRILREDHNFRWFLIGRGLMALGEMGAGFVTVSAVHRWQVADSVAGAYTAVYLIGQTVANLLFGFLADRFGHKFSLELSAVASCLAFIIAWLAPSPGWYYVVFALMGVRLGAVVVSGILVVLEFCPPEKRPTYTGLANTSIGLVGGTAPLIGTVLANVNYNWLFAASAAICLLSLVVLRGWVKEPRAVGQQYSVSNSW